MRYAAVALAVAGAVMATADEPASTVFSTKYFTITSCAPEVTNCPARSTVVSSSVVAVPTTPAVYVTESGVKPTATAPVVVVPPPSGGNSTAPPSVPAVPKPTTESGAKPVPVTTGGVAPSVSAPATLATSAAASVCGGSSVKTISTSVTTVIPTVIYETVQIPCPTPSKPSATIPGVPTGGNGTAVPPTKTPVTAGAAGLTGSAILAAVAGVAAFAFA
ncbi:GPI anchored serine-rich protein [Colletotrichum filicis]|nr:GPI anchored serine-rich protein [Colletotrichum filicis]